MSLIDLQSYRLRLAGQASGSGQASAELDEMRPALADTVTVTSRPRQASAAIRGPSRATAAVYVIADRFLHAAPVLVAVICSLALHALAFAAAERAYAPYSLSPAAVYGSGSAAAEEARPGATSIVVSSAVLAPPAE